MFKQGKYEKALEHFNEALARNSMDPDLWHDRGVCQFHLGRKREALHDMDKALELQPHYSYRYSSRAFMKGHLRDLEGAIADYRKAIELDPDDAIAHNNLGLLEEQLGHHEKARQHFRVADELSELLKEKGIDPAIYSEEEPRNIQKEIDAERAANTGPQAVFREMKSVFRSGKNFKEFLTFIRKGFRH